MLNELQELPTGLLQCKANELLDVLSGPTVIHLPGKQPEPLFVTVLQHGNEDTGWLAVRELLNDYQSRELPRALSIFISNVQAAQQGVRRLEHQIDYNRVWPGCDSSGTDEHRLMRHVWEIMRERKVFASIDIHNNSGSNPHYACINKLQPSFMQLATLFSKTVVYFIRPTGVQSLALAQLCPAVTIECGLPHNKSGTQHAKQFVEATLKLKSFAGEKLQDTEIDLFHTVAIVKIPEHLSVGIGRGDHDVQLHEQIDQLNFSEQPAGTLLGWLQGEQHAHIEAWNESGQDVAEDYFLIKDGELRTRKPLMPSMLTRDTRVIRQDCLCYLMERINMDYEPSV